MLGSLFGARTLIENQAFQAARITDIYPHRVKNPRARRAALRPPPRIPLPCCNVQCALFFPLPPAAFILLPRSLIMLPRWKTTTRFYRIYSSKGLLRLETLFLSGKWINFFFLRGGIEDVFKSIFYFIYTFCKYLWKKTKFYVVASRFPSTLNGSGFLYFCEKEIFKMEIPGNGSFSGFWFWRKISNNNNKFFEFFENRNVRYLVIIVI